MTCYTGICSRTSHHSKKKKVYIVFLNAQMLKMCNHSDHQVSNDDKNNHTQQREPVGKNIQFLGNKYCLRIKIKVHKLNKPFWQ